MPHDKTYILFKHYFGGHLDWSKKSKAQFVFICSRLLDCPAEVMQLKDLFYMRVPNLGDGGSQKVRIPNICFLSLLISKTEKYLS